MIHETLSQLSFITPTPEREKVRSINDISLGFFVLFYFVEKNSGWDEFKMLKLLDAEIVGGYSLQCDGMETLRTLTGCRGPQICDG